MTTAPLTRGQALRARSIPNRIRSIVTRAPGNFWSIVTRLDKPAADWSGALGLFLVMGVLATYGLRMYRETTYLLLALIALGVWRLRSERRDR